MILQNRGKRRESFPACFFWTKLKWVEKSPSWAWDSIKTNESKRPKAKPSLGQIFPRCHAVAGGGGRVDVVGPRAALREEDPAWLDIASDGEGWRSVRPLSDREGRSWRHLEERAVGRRRGYEGFITKHFPRFIFREAGGSSLVHWVHLRERT